MASACTTGGLILTPEQKVERENQIVYLLHKAVEELRVGTPDSLKSARASLELALELDSEDARIFDGLGCVEYREGNLGAAEDLFKQALVLNSIYERAYVHLAVIAQDRNDHQAAADLLQIALNLNPLNYRARNNYALLIRDKAHEHDIAYQELLKVYHSRHRADGVLEYNLEATN